MRHSVVSLSTCLQVVNNYDLILLLEMEDSNGKVLQGLVDQLNRQATAFSSIFTHAELSVLH